MLCAKVMHFKKIHCDLSSESQIEFQLGARKTDILLIASRFVRYPFLITWKSLNEKLF